jgi:hypothetical protein
MSDGRRESASLGLRVEFHEKSGPEAASRAATESAVPVPLIGPRNISITRSQGPVVDPSSAISSSIVSVALGFGKDI